MQKNNGIEDVNNITFNQYSAYEEVRRYGNWNMFSPDAVEASGLNKDIYLSIITHYDKLHEKYNSEFIKTFESEVK